MSDLTFEQEINRRRTFAIISHPDAGKTTLTEKLLLYGGAIHLAGSVKSRKTQRAATSDWMELEKQRGISITSSVLQFDYAGFRVNLLDTPGHQDFSEDTYRTLMAVDSAVMVLDAAKGVETQTRKLFKVCRQRGIPIFTFVNKLDRYGKEPMDLMDELEKVLGISAYPMNFPVGIDGHYVGIYHRYGENHTVELFDKDYSHGQEKRSSEIYRFPEDEKILRERIGDDVYEKLCDDITLLDEAGDEFDLEKISCGKLTPMFFGSAMTNFAVEDFFKTYLNLAPAPAPRQNILPNDEKFSAFIFKIQANMNPAHRDRLAFMRIVSGKFSRNMMVFHEPSQKQIKLTEPQQFLAQDRQIIETAYPGDIVGLFDTGIFGIGDTVSQREHDFKFPDFPVFEPEKFVRVQAKDTMKRKQFLKGMMQLTQEGAIQLFMQEGAGSENFVVGTVGILQFDVLKYRLQMEYNTEIILNMLPYEVARWLKFEDDREILPATLRGIDRGLLVYDRKNRPVLLVNNEWSLGWVSENNPGLQFFNTPQNA